MRSEQYLALRVFRQSCEQDVSVYLTGILQQRMTSILLINSIENVGWIVFDLSVVKKVPLLSGDLFFFFIQNTVNKYKMKQCVCKCSKSAIHSITSYKCITGS